MASSHAYTAQLGSHIVLAGLIIQILLFGFFVIVAVVFHRRTLANPTPQSQTSSLPWVKFLYLLYVASGLIMVRNIVRGAEFIEGFEGSIIRHEVYLYVFDALPMVAVMGVFCVLYPGRLSERMGKTASSNDGESAVSENVDLEDVEGQGK